MLRSGLSALLGSLLLALGLASAAGAADWQIVRSTGEVWIGSARAQPAALNPGATVAEGSLISTSRNGRAQLQRGGDTIVIGPNSVIMLPADQGGQTTVLQQIGEITFEVEHQDNPHFTVETPYLAAVVKGTRFTVSISRNAAAVAVHRGIVEVTDLGSGQVVDVLRDQVARIIPGRARGLLVTGAGRLGAVRPGVPRNPLVPPGGTAAPAEPAAGGVLSGVDGALGALAGGDVGGAVNGVLGDVGEVVEAVTDPVGGVVGGVLGGVGGLLGR